ncbi:30S ribosomal protein S17 [Candidatus Woesearchaeota archaeon]|nr:30S ribosomal protein S17 [Candidatus Woesearchaeota archaeon]
MKKNDCGDEHCPTHGTLKIKGRVFLGTVTSDKMQKTVTVQWDRRVFVPKYERYLKAWSRIKAHNPPCVNAKVGDYVRIRECRPLSKTKNFVVVGVMGKKEVVVPTYEHFEREEPVKE